MTLIVGRIIDDNIYMESDTKVSDENAVKVNPLLGTLKAVILNPFLCLTFAGKIHFAEKAIRSIFAQEKLNLQGLVNILFAANKESINSSGGDSNLDTDFVLAYIENKKPKFLKVANGKVEQDINNFWLGDNPAFNNYQEKYHELKSKELSEKDCMINAFKSIVEDEKNDTVGNFQISVHTDNKICPNEKVFLYTMKTEIQIVESQTVHCEKANEYYQVPLGTVAGGAYGISYLVSVSSSLHGVAMHFFYGNFGVLFCPQLCSNGIIIKNVNGNEFIDEILNKYNLPLRGIVKTSDDSLQFIDNKFRNKKTNPNN